MSTTETTVQHAVCSCHNPPLPITRDSDGDEWGHDRDETAAYTFHVHLDSRYTDCDGPTVRSNTYRICDIRPDALIHPATNFEQREPDPSDLWRYLCRTAPPTTVHSEFGEATIKVSHDRVEWSETTDEGGGGGEIHKCTEVHCMLDKATQRDLRAEGMGY